MISNIFENQIAAVLAKPLIWACVEPCMEDAVAHGIKRAVVGSFILFNHRVSSNFTIPDGVNPIQRVEVITSESRGLVTFDELVEPNFGDDSNRDNREGGPTTGADGEFVPHREGVVH